MPNPTDTAAVIRGAFVKLDPAKRLATGWASVAAINGAELVDKQADIIDLPALEDAAHEFMAKRRTAGEMHREMGVGTVVESMVVTEEKMLALGIKSEKTGWAITVKVHSDEVWAKVVSGEYGGFSIAGIGEVEE